MRRGEVADVSNGDEVELLVEEDVDVDVEELELVEELDELLVDVKELLVEEDVDVDVVVEEDVEELELVVV